MKKSFYNIKNGTDQADIYIFGIIGSSWWDSGNTAKQFVRDFKALEEKYPRINVHINSPGGDIHEGLPISNVIRASKKDVHTYVDGIAYSMGAIIAISGKTVHVASNGMLMLHNASTITWDNAKGHRTAADELDKYDDALIQTVVDKTGMDAIEVREKWFNYKDNYFTAKEAKEAGLVDEIETFKADQVPDDLKDFSMKKAMEHFANLQEHEEGSFMERITDGVKKRIGNFIKENFTPQNTPINMDFKNSQTILAKETLTKEDRAAVLAEITAHTGAAEKFTKAELDAAVTTATTETSKKVTDLEASIKVEQDAKAALTKKVEDLEKIVPPPITPGKNGGDPPVGGEPVKDEFHTPIDDERKAMEGI